ncbi:MAG: PfkB family carbohydrate kinase [Geminicoccaceae bacterium]
MTILVVGNAVVDRIYRTNRLPAPGETLLAATAERQFGGKGLNQAVAAARAGAEVRLLAAIGDDADGDAIAAYAAAEPLAAELVRLPGRSDESVILVGRDGENLIVSTAARSQALPQAAVTGALESAASGDLLLVQGNLAEATTRDLLREAGRRGLRRMANAAPLAFAWDELQAEVDLLVVNSVEAGQLGSLTAAAVVVTAGAEGATLIEAGRRIRIEAPRVDAADTTAAGDVLCGVLAAMVDRGMPLPDAVAVAVRAASLKVGRKGTSAGLPSARELRELLA